MNRILLRLFYYPGLILLTLLAIAVQTSLFSFWPLPYFQPDIVLLVVVWMALKRGFFGGGLVTLIISDFSELHSAAPQGLYFITYMTVFLAVRGLVRIVVIPNVHALIMLTLFASIFWKLECLGILHLLGSGANQWRHTLLYLFPGAVVEGLLSTWVYRGLDKYDRLTFKAVRKEHSSYTSDAFEEDLGFEGGTV